MPADAPDLSDDDIRLAGELVREAGRLALRMRSDGLSVDTKSSVTDLVSDADKAAEALIVGRLAELRPADGVVGEEGSTRDGVRTWICDPVDGTFNFVTGSPVWCCALALTIGDRPLLGAIYQPAADELWIGGPGIPTTLNGVPVAPLPDRPLSETSMATWLNPSRIIRHELLNPWLRLLAASGVPRITGSSSVELAATSGGRLGCWVHFDVLPWDWYPGAALVLGAGGVTQTFDYEGVRWFLAGTERTVGEARIAITAG